RLVELALRQPADRKIGSGTGKRMLRTIAARFLPDGVVSAPKRPLQTPQREWLRGPLEDWTRDLVAAALAGCASTWRDRAGIDRARGEWIARMDADDLCGPDRLACQMAFLEAHPECAFVGTTYGIITPNGKRLVPKQRFDWKYLRPLDITAGTELFADPSAV